MKHVVLNFLVDNGVFLPFDNMIVLLVMIRRCSFTFFVCSFACRVACRVFDIRRMLNIFNTVFLRRNGFLLSIHN